MPYEKPDFVKIQQNLIGQIFTKLQKHAPKTLKGEISGIYSSAPDDRKNFSFGKNNPNNNKNR